MKVFRTDLKTDNRHGIWRVERRRWWFGRLQYIHVTFDGPPHAYGTYAYYRDLENPTERGPRVGGSLERRILRRAAAYTHPARWHDAPELPEARVVDEEPGR